MLRARLSVWPTSSRRRALSLGLGLSRTGVAHSGIHADYLDPAPERDWRWRLLYVGRLDPRKGVDVAVEALAHLPPEARLEIAGGWDNKEEARLGEVAARLGVEGRVRFARSGGAARDVGASSRLSNEPDPSRSGAAARPEGCSARTGR